MMKLIWLLLIALAGWRLVVGRWPWEPSRRAVRSRLLARSLAQSLAEAHAVLGTGPGASREQIVEAHRRRIALVHPDRGGSNEAVHEANAARDLLLADR